MTATGALAGTDGVAFLDGSWNINGTSFWDPDTGVVGDEVDDSAAASDGLLTGSTASSGGGGTSSGPFLGSYEWAFEIRGFGARGVDNFPGTIIDLSILGSARRSSAPGTSGFVSTSFNVTTPILFQVFSDSTDYLPFEVLDNGTQSISFSAFDTGGPDSGDIVGSTLKPGVYQISSFFLGTPPDPIVDGITITQTQMVDFELRILPAPHSAIVLLATMAATTRRRR